jgi:hypothetical protein
MLVVPCLLLALGNLFPSKCFPTYGNNVEVKQSLVLQQTAGRIRCFCLGLPSDVGGQYLQEKLRHSEIQVWCLARPGGPSVLLLSLKNYPGRKLLK